MGGKQSRRARRGTLTKSSHRGVLVGSVAGHKDAVLCCAFSPDGKYLASSSADGSVMIWNVPSLKRRHRLENEHSHAGAVTSVSFSPDSSLLISGKAFSSLVRKNEVLILFLFCSWKGLQSDLVGPKIRNVLAKSSQAPCRNLIL